MIIIIITIKRLHNTDFKVTNVDERNVVILAAIRAITACITLALPALPPSLSRSLHSLHTHYSFFLNYVSSKCHLKRLLLFYVLSLVSVSLFFFLSFFFFYLYLFMLIKRYLFISIYPSIYPSHLSIQQPLSIHLSTNFLCINLYFIQFFIFFINMYNIIHS